MWVAHLFWLALVKVSGTFTMVSLSTKNEMNRAFSTYRLNWARRTSWGWWDDWDDTGFEIRALAVWGRALKKQFCFFQTPRPGTEPRTLAWKAAVLATTLGPPPSLSTSELHIHYGWPLYKWVAYSLCMAFVYVSGTFTLVNLCTCEWQIHHGWPLYKWVPAYYG